MRTPGSIKVVDGKVKTTIRLLEDLYWQFQAKKSERRISSDEAAINEAVRQWVSGVGVGSTGSKTPAEDLAKTGEEPHIKSATSGIQYPPEIQPWIEMLVDILTGDHQRLEVREAVNAVQSVLRPHYRYIGKDPDELLRAAAERKAKSSRVKRIDRAPTPHRKPAKDLLSKEG